MNNASKKEKIREELLARRSKIPEGTYHKKSAQICERLYNLKVFQEAKTVHCYVSMNERREVNTHLLIKEMLTLEIKVIVPITQMKTGELKHIRLKSFGDLKKNKWGVLEPEEGEEVALEVLDLVVVPMAGGDPQKNRIGYGKGFYDRFLAKADCPAIGLVFETCMVDAIPTEPFDVPLDTLVTEKTIY